LEQDSLVIFNIGLVQEEVQMFIALVCRHSTIFLVYQGQEASKVRTFTHTKIVVAREFALFYLVVLEVVGIIVEKYCKGN
jgi:hypothetical protein